MLFNSLAFIYFFVVVTVLYFYLKQQFRWLLLLGASCYFYMFFIPYYILILFGTILIDYAAGIWIEEAKGKRKKQFLILSIAANVSVLALFKYADFFLGNLNNMASLLGWNYSIELLGWILPVGLSFHTFQAMAYTIEVYRGHQKAERHLGLYALYVMYFPQLVAGPIERPQHILPQLRVNHRPEWDRIISGLKIMVWGFFKKIVIADRLAVFVNPVYDNPENYHGISMFVATVFFAVQIYCDFSGYSDIAVGSSKVLGIRLMENFRSPYMAGSFADFWKRWHISLSSWFRDFVYIPLGGNNGTTLKTSFNLLLVFLLSGFWHGANWTFVIWGLLHGMYLIVEKYFPVKFNWSSFKVFSLLKWFIVFFLVCIAWVFFRADSTAKAFTLFLGILSGIPAYFGSLFFEPDFLWLEPLLLNRDPVVYRVDFLILLFSIPLLGWIHFWERNNNVHSLLDAKPLLVRFGFYFFVFHMILFSGAFHQGSEFIYFQF